MYNRDQIELVRSKLDIVEIIREYVPSLKSAGRSVKGLCPFHGERTPSFHVQPEKGLYKCFGCGEAGDVIGFISKLEQVGFTEALEMLAGRAGVPLAKTVSGGFKQEPEGLREKLYRLLESAARYYEEQLWDDRVGQPARAYLEERGITAETTERFGLGFAPTSGAAAFETLVKKGFAIELCQQAGLAARSSAGRFYDPMFGRLIFPILDGFGHVVGFGGRIMPAAKKKPLGQKSTDVEEESGPKYLNSPESPVFSKGKMLYGLFQAKSHILAARTAVVVEGYMDVIGVHQGGLQTAVATLGTALTRDHTRMLKRYASEVVAFFDPDEAGQRAAVRGLEPLVQEDLYTRVVVAEDDNDPDELIREKGKEHVERMIAEAPDFVDFLLNSSAVTAGNSLQEKAELARQILAVIALSPNEILKGEWSLRVAEKLNLRAESMERELNKKAPAAKAPPQRPPVPVASRTDRFLPSAEEEFLQLLITSPEVWPDVGLTADDFVVPRHQWLFARLVDQMRRIGRVSVAELYDETSAADKDWLLTLSLEEKTFADPIERRQTLIRDVRMNRERKRLADLSQRISAGPVSDGELGEYKDLLRRVKGSPRALSGSGKVA